MQARTLTARNHLVGTDCRHCNRVLAAGDQVVTHHFGRDAPWDLQTFTVHADCARKVLRRLPALAEFDSVLTRAAQFREITARVAAGGPLFDA